MNTILSIILGYVLGSLPFAYMIGKLKKDIDLRKMGSGNLGATNVLRNLGFVSFLLCALFDIGKSFVAFKLAQHFLGDINGPVAGLAAVIGHCYSPFMKFKGGKGVATSGGLILAYDWKLLLISGIVFLSLVLISRRMSLGSVGVALAFPFLYYIFNGFDFYFFGAILLAGFVIFKHRENISRLLKGTEPKIF